MYLYHRADTIAAIATSSGESGIAIVRISGPQALLVAESVFVPARGGRVDSFPSHSLHYGWIVSDKECPGGKGNPPVEFIDEVMLGIMRAPRSYTREDVVEINCHGGSVSVRRVFDAVISRGCRLADPGEFTLRAFLNGRIDLAQAEAVMDVITAKTDAASRSGIAQLKGELSRKIAYLRAELLAVLAELEAAIDFPEEGAGSLSTDSLNARISSARQGMAALLETARCGIPIREGASVVICGRPNTGKSSLLNALLKIERSIVAPLEGTTRDSVEETLDIKGIPVRLIDTAGIKEPRDIVEKKAVLRSRRCIDNADLIILLFDGSKPLEKQDKVLLGKLKKKKNVLAVVNKSDLKQRLRTQEIEKQFGSPLPISAKKGINMAALEEQIARRIFSGAGLAGESVFISNRRHLEILKSSEKFLRGAQDSCLAGVFTELVAQDIRDALLGLDSILGLDFSEDVLQKIFGDFCIGK